MTTKLGDETRTNLLPSAPPASDFTGPNYSYADELPLPGSVGVHQGDTLESVIDSVKGVAYYADMIGYGQPSNALTRSLSNKPYPMGLNYFVRSGSKCSNGADMWVYINGIPTGEALGAKVQAAMRSAGLPDMKGLAPGILEDAEAALNPSPLIDAVFGSGYTKCKQVTLPVGDSLGRIKSSDGAEWVRAIKPGDISFSSGQPTQTRWVFDKSVTQEEDAKEAKTFCPDGSFVTSHQGSDCTKPFTRVEGWKNYEITEVTIPVVLTVCLITALYLRFK